MLKKGKKLLIIGLISLCALSCVASLVITGMIIYTRSTTTPSQPLPASTAPSITTTE